MDGSFSVKTLYRRLLAAGPILESSLPEVESFCMGVSIIFGYQSSVLIGLAGTFSSTSGPCCLKAPTRLTMFGYREAIP